MVYQPSFTLFAFSPISTRRRMASGKREDVDDPQDLAEIAKLDRLIARLGDALRFDESLSKGILS
jgi:hypothetical protein